MKKVLFFILVLLTVVGCNQSTEYVITGTVENPALNGLQVHLLGHMGSADVVVIDSAIITNKKFSFKGDCDSATMAMMSYTKPENEQIRQSFVLESGKMNVVIDLLDQIQITGTEQNDALNAFNKQIKKIEEQNDEYYTAYSSNEEKADEERAALMSKMEELYNEAILLNVTFAKNNANTVVGTQLFTNTYYSMSIPQKEEIIALMNDETKRNSLVKRIISDVEIEKRTSVGGEYIDFKLFDENGKEKSVSDALAGNEYLLIDFWASWCTPCIRSFPELKTLYNKYKNNGFEIIGVSLDDKMEAWQNAIQRYDLNWQHISDMKGWHCKGAELYAINSIPATILIDKENKIVGRNLSIAEIETFLKK